jgi:hypothetical protein
MNRGFAMSRRLARSGDRSIASYSPRCALVLAAAGLILLGCAGNGGNGLVGGSICEDPERYAGAGSAEPLRIPDHLAPPDDRNALWIPPEPAVDPEPIERLGDCLESPPRFLVQGG